MDFWWGWESQACNQGPWHTHLTVIFSVTLPHPAGSGRNISTTLLLTDLQTYLCIPTSENMTLVLQIPLFLYLYILSRFWKTAKKPCHKRHKHAKNEVSSYLLEWKEWAYRWERNSTTLFSHILKQKFVKFILGLFLYPQNNSTILMHLLWYASPSQPQKIKLVNSFDFFRLECSSSSQIWYKCKYGLYVTLSLNSIFSPRLSMHIVFLYVKLLMFSIKIY